MQQWCLERGVGHLPLSQGCSAPGRPGAQPEAPFSHSRSRSRRRAVGIGLAGLGLPQGREQKWFVLSHSPLGAGSGSG